MANIFTEKHEIPYYECDVTGNLTLPMILNIVIKTSEAQSDSLNRGVDYLSERQLGWVITQHDMTITQLPKVGDMVTVSTAAHSYNKFFCYRDFWIHNEAGEECVHIETTFVIMDLEKRKMTSVSDEVIAPYGCEKTTKIKRPEKVVFPDEMSTKMYHVRYTDIDSNRHVNNTKYLEWMIDGLSYDFLVANRGAHLVIKFDKEVYYGEDVTVSTALNAEENTSVHQVMTTDGLSATAKIEWVKR